MVTQKEIAEKLGISRQLVTLALAGYPQVSEKSRKRIAAAARKMGYSPNPHARALKQGRTGIIALWIPDQISSHYIHVARELNRLLKREKYELIITEVGTMSAEQALSHVPVDGIFIVDAPATARRHLESEAGAASPVICMGPERHPELDFVQVDLMAGTVQAMKHLIETGFRRIAHATFLQKDQPGASRRAGYLQTMREAGLKPEFLYYPLTEQQRPLVRQLVKDYVKKNECPDAIFCHSDDVALGIYRGLCDLKLRVPHDVALVGHDGIQDTEYLECSLTTIVQPVPEMCAAAWQFLQRRLENPALEWQSALLSPSLVIRESSVRPPA
jgi:DNA-binding LacI/PurR family transcriptional regulator